MPSSLTAVFRPWEGSEKEALPQSANTERHWAETTSWVTYQNHPAYSSANVLTPGLDFVSIISWRYSDEFPTTLQLTPRAAFPCYMASDFVKGSLDDQEHQKQGFFALVKTLSSEFIKRFWAFAQVPLRGRLKTTDPTFADEYVLFTFSYPALRVLLEMLSCIDLWFEPLRLVLRS